MLQRINKTLRKTTMVSSANDLYAWCMFHIFGVNGHVCSTPNATFINHQAAQG